MITRKLHLTSLAFAAVAALMTSQAVEAEISEKDFSKSIDRYLATDEGVAKIGSAIEKYFQKRQQDALKQKEEKAKADLESQFKNPVKIDPGDSPVKGPKNAKVTIIEFSDFQCPYCKRGKETMDAVLKAYPKDVKVVFKHYPLPFHKEAEPAAKASWAAQQQGKFWEFHDELFNNQDKLGSAFYLATAKKLKLDEKKFKTDMNSSEAAKQVKLDADTGSKNGIQGTPGFFVNGVAVKGAYPVPHFAKIIDRWLNSGVNGAN